MRKLHLKCAAKQYGIRKKRCMHFKELLHCAENQMFLAVIQYAPIHKMLTEFSI